MAEKFYTILTNVGLAKIANSQVTGNKVNLVEMAVGDSNGSYYNPTSNDVTLRNEKWRGPIGSVEIDEDNANWIVIETVIPSETGGFTLREVGLFDEEGDLIAIGKYPETYKPVLDEGSAKDLYIRMIIEVSNASAVTLKVDPTVIIASRKYVDEKIALAVGPINQSLEDLQTLIGEYQQDLAAHLADYVKHPAFAVATGTANNYMVILNPAPTSYVDGMGVIVAINIDATGASTLKVNNLAVTPIKKANGNNATNLKANGVYTLRYNSATSSFILQGEGGSGNLQPNQALAGYTFTNDEGEQVGVGDPNLIPENIKFGSAIFNVMGTVHEDPIPTFVVGDHLVATSSGLFETYSKTFVKAHKIQIHRDGNIRVRIEARNQNNAAVGRVQIYVNGVPQGVVQTIERSSFYYLTQDIANVKSGDIIQLYFSASQSVSYYSQVKSFSIMIGNQLPYATPL